jgi:hypothetical protein
MGLRGFGYDKKTRPRIYIYIPLWSKVAKLGGELTHKNDIVCARQPWVHFRNKMWWYRVCDIPLWPKSSFMTTLGFNPRYAVQGMWDFSINDAVGINLYRFVTNVYRLATFLVQDILTWTMVGILGDVAPTLCYLWAIKEYVNHVCVVMR